MAEKVKEAVTILKKLKDLGIPETEPGYKMMKEKFDAWIRSDESWSGDVYFPRFGRRAEVNLPTKAGRVSTVNLLKPHQ